MRRLVLLTSLLILNPALAREASVGPGCTFTDLQSAINFVAGDASGPDRLLLRQGTIPIPSGVVINLQADLSIEGGYSGCGSGAGAGRTVLDAAGGPDGTAITVFQGNNAIDPRLGFTRVEVTGASGETGPFANPEGGGLELRGRMRVVLGEQTEISDNRSGRGGGIYLLGNGPTARVVLSLIEGARVLDNAVVHSGGGIYCHDNATILLDDGDVSFNSAARGGGIDLAGASCLLDSQVAANAFTGINNNAGGGLETGAGRVLLRGRPGAPFYFIGNTGGGAHLGNRSATRVNHLLRNVVFHLNEAGTGGPAGGLSVFDNVRVVIESTSDQCSLFGLQGCSAFFNNVGPTAASGGGAITSGALTGEAIIEIRRTRFSGNRGGAAVYAGFSGAVLDAEGLLVEGNVATAAASGSLHSEVLLSARQARIRHTTITGNSARFVFDDFPEPLDLGGSILWHTGGRVLRASGARSIDYEGCLLASDTHGLPDPARIITGDPRLDAGFIPSRGSPALDACDALPGAESFDYAGRPRGIDQPTVPDRLGPYDLGALEAALLPPQGSDIFANGFESP
ncbi:hypothetical protein [Pseudomarimonas salicorniae]|uniref:CSLREA domain-containing protein n=1 Tax=Pseudomarimonas salicorniae TaxID=2933270 RepID=A0ABT0GEU3_9GAMM|nr:hypothetical protein [Lysobacter sp. CAU 1642]MCK7593051.1 hypothetical protein [Lysobacter sp. CAU 1642]